MLQLNKKIMKKILTLTLAVALWGCGQSGELSSTGGEFIGVWQRSDSECPECNQWVISETKEGGLLAEHRTTKDLKYRHVRMKYNTTYEAATEKLIIHTGMDYPAGIVNGRLNVQGKIFEKVK